ncbi:MAG TPA: universal stress protein [Methylomirabilota bacterium]|nr:universal stress protein [Methylomirabilota bacterium]
MIAPRIIAVQEILLATDFSPHSHHAFRTALALAEHFGARLHTLYVVESPSEQKAGLAKLKVFAGTEGDEIEIVKSVAVGSASSEIVSYAQREKIDLIVIGTHGRTGRLHTLAGSVAEAVVRTAPCQVLTVKLPEEAQASSAQSAPAKPRVEVTELHCLVCAQPSQELICDRCKARIRGEALDRKSKEERAGRRGLPI